MAADPTLEQFLADLKALKDAIDVVQRQADSIKDTMGDIDTRMNGLATHWASPSYQSFDDVKSWFHRTQHGLSDMLDDILTRMQTSYWNYHDAEAANFSNIGDGVPNPLNGGQRDV